MKGRIESRSLEDREAFLAEHWDEIRLLARCVVKNQSGPWSQSFVDDAPAIVWLRMAGYDRDRPFRPWCRRVLQNALRDRYRRIQRERRSIPREDSDMDSVFSLREIDRHRLPETQRLAALDLHEPFEPDDLATVQSWRTPTRVTLLAFYGLPPKIPQRCWAEWTRSMELQPDFPNLSGCSFQWSERVAELASLMDRPVNTVSKTLKRHSGKLYDLRFVQDCLLHT